MSIAVVETDELLERIRLVIREEVGASGMAHEEPEGWLNTEAAAKYLGVSQETIRSAVRGHGIPVTLTFSLVDVTTNTLLDSGSTAVGHGHAHPNQTTTSCGIVLFEGTAADFFGPEPLPPGVAATDIVRFSLAVEVILQL